MTTYNVPHTFIPGTKANAEHINENFSSVMGKIEETKQSSANLDLSNLTTAGKKAIFDNSSRSKLIGEIITSAIPLSDSGLHLLDGAKLLGGGIYDKFIQYIAGLVSSHPSLFVTETVWQESVSAHGVCGKFVYDSTNNTVRLPKITGFLEGTTDTTALGSLIEAGLPNITGTPNFATSNHELFGTITASSVKPTGCYKESTATVNRYANTGTGANYKQALFDASGSNSIYGNSDTVQPQAVKVLYYIVVSTTAKLDIEVDIDNITTDLNGKAEKDFSNVEFSETFINKSIGWSLPDYSTGVLWSVTTGATFTAPYDCIVFHTEGFKNDAENKYYFNGNSDYSIYSRSGGNIWTIRTSIYALKKDEYVTGFHSGDENRINQFIYYKFSGQTN